MLKYQGLCWWPFFATLLSCLSIKNPKIPKEKTLIPKSHLKPLSCLDPILSCFSLPTKSPILSLKKWFLWVEDFIPKPWLVSKSDSFGWKISLQNLDFLHYLFFHEFLTLSQIHVFISSCELPKLSFFCEVLWEEDFEKKLTILPWENYCKNTTLSQFWWSHGWRIMRRNEWFFLWMKIYSNPFNT